MSSTGGPTSDVFAGTWDATSFLVAICSALAGYNATELLLLIFTTFYVYRGLYFWSLLVATAGIIPYFIGLCIFYFGFTYRLIGYIINNLGWIAMVTGQSVVLYSRLGVVLGSGYESLLKFVKWMIIVDGFVFHVTTATVTFCSHYAPNPVPWQRAYHYVERIQMTGFCIQEFIISGIYIWKALDILKTGQRKHMHRIMAQLFVINLIIVILDIGLLVLEYKNLFIPEVAFKELSYSVKLKLEFAILSKLVEFTNTGQRRHSNFFGDTSGFLDKGGGTQSFDTTMQRIASSPTVRSDSRPQWIHDLERAETHDVARHRAASRGSDALVGVNSLSPISPSVGFSTEHNSGSEPVPGGKLPDTTNPDLMYAEAMRTISKYQ